MQRGKKCLKGTGRAVGQNSNFRKHLQCQLPFLTLKRFVNIVFSSTWNSTTTAKTLSPMLFFISAFHIKYHSTHTLIYFFILYLNSIDNNVLDLKWIRSFFLKKNKVIVEHFCWKYKLACVWCKGWTFTIGVYHRRPYKWPWRWITVSRWQWIIFIITERWFSEEQQ